MAKVTKTLNKRDKFHLALSEMKKILAHYQQNFFLACGTLLGQVRENDYIVWDNDIDLGIFRSEYRDDLKQLICETGRFKLRHELGRLNENYELCFIHWTGIRIDIFLHYPIENEKDFYYYPTFFGACDQTKEGYCKWGVHIRGLKEIKFSHSIYLTPKNAEEYLTESYGDDWETPQQYSYIEALNKGYYKNLIN